MMSRLSCAVALWRLRVGLLIFKFEKLAEKSVLSNYSWVRVQGYLGPGMVPRSIDTTHAHIYMYSMYFM
jgi:hypothetical protein